MNHAGNILCGQDFLSSIIQNHDTVLPVAQNEVLFAQAHVKDYQNSYCDMRSTDVERIYLMRLPEAPCYQQRQHVRQYCRIPPLR